MRTLLIANRGEIALRVMRTARALGIRTVALATELDRDAPHTHAADVVVPVPSYLDIDAVVAAAVSSGADAVHPGYGFLSERAPFAAALEAAGIALVGPTAAVMEQMGRKDAAREIAVAAGVPVVPAYPLVEETGVSRLASSHLNHRPDDSASHLETKDLTYPVLVKAAAGGGGKGMRVVRSEAELADALASARREAASAFGDDTMLVEKYVERGRHIEVQVIGDTHGTVLHLGERDCSTQRRHQKVLEEAPAPTLDDATRARLHAAAVDLARHVGYVNAGTVEFLLDPVEFGGTGEFYFLEMNTRLQVEHPVTEEVWGVDLVELQLRVAAGEPLGLTQADLAPRGHAIEARVYAEDSFAGFLPQAGRAGLVAWPSGGCVRVDAGLESGQVVSTAYDPMLGKVIAHGPDRESARRRLIAALDRTAVLGLTTNAGFLRALLATDEFRDATIDTAWLDRTEVEPPDATHPRTLAAWARHRARSSQAGPFAADGFRLGGDPAPVVVRLDDDVVLAGPAPLDDAAATVVTAHGVELAWRGQRFSFAEPDPFSDSEAVAGDGTVLAPMPGTVLEVRVAAGDVVEEGQVLGMMEAMKMELTLRAPFDGTVAQVDADAGRQVALGAPLFVVESAGSGAVS